MGKRMVDHHGVKMYLIFNVLFSCQRSSDSGEVFSEYNSINYQLNFTNHREQISVFKNNFGEIFQLDIGYVVPYSIRIYECSSHVNILNYYLISNAYAGHSEFAIATDWGQPQVQNILDPKNVQSFVQFPNQSLCELMLTFARADSDTLNLPTAISMNNLSIYLKGTCEKDFELQDFEIFTAIPSEKLFDLSSKMPSHSEDSLMVLIEMSFDSLFENISCGQSDSNVAGLQALTNILKSTTIEIR